MTAEVTLLAESGPELIEFDPRTYWKCTCGGTSLRTGQVPAAAPEVCEHVVNYTRAMPAATLARMATAARAAAGKAPLRASSLP